MVQKTIKTISYDRENDILFLHKGFSEREKFKGNMDIGNLILDVSTTGRIRGIEIIEASEFLKEFKIGQSILQNIKDAEFETKTTPTSITIGLTLKTKNQEIPAKIAVPLQTKF